MDDLILKREWEEFDLGCMYFGQGILDTSMFVCLPVPVS